MYFFCTSSRFTQLDYQILLIFLSKSFSSLPFLFLFLFLLPLSKPSLCLNFSSSILSLLASPGPSIATRLVFLNCRCGHISSLLHSISSQNKNQTLRFWAWGVTLGSLRISRALVSHAFSLLTRLWTFVVMQFFFFFFFIFTSRVQKR